MAGPNLPVLPKEAEAWFEYLQSCLYGQLDGIYDEVEPWAWDRLSKELKRLAEREAVAA
jgi:hypothetical protein